jgi:Ca2+-binding RTX toxin-like protein
MDFVDYSASATAVSINLSTWTALYGDAQGDQLSGVDGVIGTNFNDTIIGFDDQSVSGADIYTNMFYGAGGSDYIDGRASNDILYGGADNDSIYGGTGDDASYGGTGTDQIYAGDGNDSSFGDEGNDLVYGGLGNDLIDGGADNDSLYGDAGNDSIGGGSGNDLAYGGDGNDAAYGGSGTDSLYGGAGSDLLYGGDGSDLLDGGGVGNDTLYGDAGNDSLSGGDGNDLMDGGADNDVLDAGTGNDSAFGGSGQDTLYGGAGNDALSGGDGNDLLAGGDGDDVLFGGTGVDSLYGGVGNDTIYASLGGVIDGGGGNDVLNLTGQAPYQIVRTPGVPGSGVINFLDSAGHVIGTLAYSNVENIVSCFTPGTEITTPKGGVLIEQLRVGDVVVTRDNGSQVVRWIGSRRISRDEMRQDPSLRPILIKAGAMGDGLPETDMMVSRQHRMLVSGQRAELLFGTDEVLVRAQHLLCLPGVSVAEVDEVTYLHILFDRHEVVLANGAWSESFQPGDRTLGGMDADQRDEICKIFPELAQAGRAEAFAAARTTLKSFEARVLLAA